MNFNTTRGQVIVIFLNAFIRFAQLVAGVVTICLYSTQTGYWLNHGIGGRIVSVARQT